MHYLYRSDLEDVAQAYAGMLGVLMVARQVKFAILLRGGAIFTYPCIPHLDVTLGPVQQWTLLVNNVG